MQRKKKRLTALLLYVPLLLIAYLLQDTVFSELPIGGARPLILPVAVVGAAMFGGRLRGGVFGLCAGILCDVSLCRPAVLFTLLLTLAGIAIGALFETVLARGFLSFVLCCAALLLVSAFCQMFGLLFFSGQRLTALLAAAGYQTLYSLFFTVPVYLLVRLAGRKAR
ncbi:MAG: hypothetical protein IK136_05435 [Oscillospiraceae bacterium]|nr:hypothetical protein [Oscillospiraceae bacterium]